MTFLYYVYNTDRRESNYDLDSAYGMYRVNKKRLRTLQQGNPKKLRVIRTILSTQLHEKFDQERLVGEWSDIDRDDVSSIKEER